MSGGGRFKKNSVMLIKRVIKEVIILSALAVTTAFGVNYFSPNGIALMGEWDPDRGAISARAKQDAVLHELEITDPEIAKKIYDGGTAVFVDARAADYYYEGHIKGAVSLPLGSVNDVIDTFKKNVPPRSYIITYCSGRECDDSHQLAQYLLENGYENVSVFIDGYPGWVERGYPVDSKM